MGLAHKYLVKIGAGAKVRDEKMKLKNGERLF
jgi:hypothetical protein